MDKSTKINQDDAYWISTLYAEEQLYLLEDEKILFPDIVEWVEPQEVEEDLEEELIVVQEEVEAVPTIEQQEVVEEVIQEEAPKPKATRIGQQGIPYFGENKKNMLVLLEYSQEDLLNSREFTLLLKIMGAINLTLHEFAVVNILDTGVTFEQLKAQFAPEKILYFTASEDSELFGGKVEKYVGGRWDGIPVIFADSLTQMLMGEQVAEMKKMLWEALKKHFMGF
ncbi:hypothetical protein [Algivirga pacifica]|uniref:Uncharacterized protein n=1 Tax=Algivirga pacifica TaxID=1162670 RepID=A0ABP9CYF0_9BACT